jgi:hypothetical protein
MAPTLRHGDAVLVLRGGRPVRPGDIVVARFRSRPDLLVVKRAVRQAPAAGAGEEAPAAGAGEEAPAAGAGEEAPDQGGWWLEGDSPVVADDSRAYGFAQVEGRVVARYWPRPRLL